MKDPRLREVVSVVAAKFKKKSYDELKPIISEPVSFLYDYKNARYRFEVSAIRSEDGGIRVRVEGAKNRMFSVGFAEYFAMTSSGDVVSDGRMAF